VGRRRTRDAQRRRSFQRTTTRRGPYHLVSINHGQSIPCVCVCVMIKEKEKEKEKRRFLLWRNKQTNTVKKEQFFRGLQWQEILSWSFPATNFT
jgi:hypothetical protein